VLSVVLVLFMASATALAAGRTFYVDFDHGADDRDGLSDKTAFKHAPGDAEAGEAVKKITLAAGDKVLFKGGVAYRGTIIVAESGADGAPIVYDGNSAGTFGQGKAIIDGSEITSGWKQCANADEAGGNPNFKNIWYTALPGKLEGLTLNLVQDDKLLELSRDPNAKDPFFFDELDNMRPMHQPLPTTSGEVTTVVNPEVFTQSAADAWDGAYMEVWLKPNFVHCHKVISFDPAAHQLKVEKFKGDQYPGDRGKFAMMNHMRLIDRAGEYALAPASGDTARVYLWPLEVGGDGPKGTITYSTRANGIVIGGKSNIEVNHFIIQKQSGDVAMALVTRSNSSNVTIRNNEVRFLNSVNRGGAVNFSNSKNVVMDGNSVHHNRRVRGIAGSGENITVANNVLEKNGGTGIGFFGVKHGKMIGNTVSDHAGVHANGLTVYADSDDVLVEGNKVFSSRVSLTLQDSQNVTIQNNIFDRGVGGTAMAIWTSKFIKHIKVYHNLMLKSDDAPDYMAAIFTNAKPEVIEGLDVRNNIIDGLSGPLSGQHFDHNLYLSWGPLQKDKKLGEGEKFEDDLKKLFVDPAKGDYRPKPGSPALGAGADIGVEKDITGAARPKGKAPSIGPYQQ
jgi:parallel beta-helix repeat protein